MSCCQKMVLRHKNCSTPVKGSSVASHSDTSCPWLGSWRGCLATCNLGYGQKGFEFYTGSTTLTVGLAFNIILINIFFILNICSNKTLHAYIFRVFAVVVMLPGSSRAIPEIGFITKTFNCFNPYGALSFSICSLNN